MKKVIRGVFQFSINVAFIAAFWYGGIQHVDWVWNLARFLIWLNFILSILVTMVVLANEDTKAKMKEKGFSLPRWLSTVSDIIGIIILAGGGYFLYATLWTVQAILEGVCRDAINETKVKEVK